MFKFIKYAVFFSTITVSSFAFAGTYVTGPSHHNLDTAMNMAFALAEAKVRSRKEGCVGRGYDDHTTQEMIINTNNGLFTVSVFISYHNGSCKLKLSTAQNIARETGIDVNRLLRVW
jgi:hypothetical protein